MPIPSRKNMRRQGRMNGWKIVCLVEVAIHARTIKVAEMIYMEISGSILIINKSNDKLYNLQIIWYFEAICCKSNQSNQLFSYIYKILYTEGK